MSAKQDEQGNETEPRPILYEDYCKGCGRCIAACPKNVLRFKSTLNRRSVKPAEYVGSGCIGCSLCFYTCPEPFAIEVRTPDKKNPKDTTK